MTVITELCCGVGLYHVIKTFLGDESDVGATIACLIMFFDDSLKCDMALTL